MANYVSLNKEQLNDRAKTLANTVRELDSVEAEAKQVQQEYRKRLKQLNLDIRELSETIRTGNEYHADSLFSTADTV